MELSLSVRNCPLARRRTVGPHLCIDNVSTFTQITLVMNQPVRTERSRARTSGRKDDVIQIRASAETKSILNRAAGLRGQKLSEFMLDSARRQAEETILDQRNFFLDPDAHEKFLAMLDASERPSAELRNRVKRKPSWDR